MLTNWDMETWARPVSQSLSLTTWTNPAPAFHFGDTFTIKPDGSIERGPAFTTTDAAALEFWAAVERLGFERLPAHATGDSARY